MSEILSRMSSMEAFRCRIPATIEQITKAEEILGLVFSDEYKEYLKGFGCASVYGKEFTGICSNSRLNVVDVTFEVRKMIKNLPSNFYVIEETNIDGIVICQEQNGIVYKVEPNKEIVKLCNSLVEYLEI